MRRTLSTAALLLASGCLGDLLNIGEGPDKKGAGGRETGRTGGTGGSSATSGASSAGDGGDGAGDGGAGAATGGSPASGGSATGGGATGGSTGGTSGGGAGSGGRGGSGATGGTSAPTSDPDVLARAAVVLGSCYGDGGVSRSADSLWTWRKQSGFWSNFRLQAACITEAGQGCGALDTCLGWAIEEAPGCTPGRVCDGSKFTDCIDVEGVGTVEWRLDCSTIGFECDTRVVCASPPTVACDVMTYVENCAGERLQTCNYDPDGPRTGVVYSGTDCAELGLECAAGIPGSYDPIECTGTGETCDLVVYGLFDGIACAGSTLQTCVNGRRHDLDCSTLGPGFSCQSYNGIPFCGLGSACLPANLWDYGDDISADGDPEPACDGTSITFCNAGRLERIDCTDLGFTGCDLELGLGCVPSPTSDLRRASDTAR